MINLYFNCISIFVNHSDKLARRLQTVKGNHSSYFHLSDQTRWPQYANQMSKSFQSHFKENMLHASILPIWSDFAALIPVAHSQFIWKICERLHKCTYTKYTNNMNLLQPWSWLDRTKPILLNFGSHDCHPSSFDLVVITIISLWGYPHNGFHIEMIVIRDSHT